MARLGNVKGLQLLHSAGPGFLDPRIVDRDGNNLLHLVAEGHNINGNEGAFATAQFLR